jgi:DNA-binding CsgD family transcriptional regulator/GAF domain-containing protein
MERQLGELTQAIYDAAVEPGGWADVTTLLQRQFRSPASGLYRLDRVRGGMRKLHVSGFEAQWLRVFSECYFTRDNPWLRAKPLHQPGVVRTDERLVAVLGDPRALVRSQYYNEWMRPQRLVRTLGVTLLSENGVATNLTLLRPRTDGSFSKSEFATFQALCAHLRRALRFSSRLESASIRGDAAVAALDCLPYGAVLLTLGGRVVHANAAAETLFRSRDGLAVANGRLRAAEFGEQWKLDAFLHQVADYASPRTNRPPDAVSIGRRTGAAPLALSAIRFSAPRRAAAVAESMILVTVTLPEHAQPRDLAAAGQRYQLTPAELRLAMALTAGKSLRAAAEEARMTYETARWYLKVLFQKTGTNRQAQLVALLMNDRPLRLDRRGDR